MSKKEIATIYLLPITLALVEKFFIKIPDLYIIANTALIILSTGLSTYLLRDTKKEKFASKYLVIFTCKLLVYLSYLAIGILYNKAGKEDFVLSFAIIYLPSFILENVFLLQANKRAT